MFSQVFSPLGDPLAMGTFRVSGNGLGLYISSKSEIQRLCIVSDDMCVREREKNCFDYVLVHTALQLGW